MFVERDWIKEACRGSKSMQVLGIGKNGSSEAGSNRITIERRTQENFERLLSVEKSLF